MPQITIPLGSEIRESKKDNIKIKVPGTNFSVIGEKTENLWNIYLIDPRTKRQMMIKAEVTTRAFATISSLILKTPLPFEGKRKNNVILVKRFIKKIIKNQ
jgi:hypothetical protein